MALMRGTKLLFFILTMAVVSVATATVMIHLDVDELSRRSDIVVVGTIVDTTTRIVDHYPWTVATVEVHDSFLKGVSRTIQVETPGGIQMINGKMLVTRIDGAATFRKMDKAVFFLRENVPQSFQLVGWSQGFWHIQNTNGKEMAVAGDESGVHLSLEELRARVQKAAREKQQ